MRISADTLSIRFAPIIASFGAFSTHLTLMTCKYVSMALIAIINDAGDSSGDCAGAGMVIVLVSGGWCW